MGKLVLSTRERDILFDLVKVEHMPPGDLLRWLLWKRAVEKRVWLPWREESTNAPERAPEPLDGTQEVQR